MKSTKAWKLAMIATGANTSGICLLWLILLLNQSHQTPRNLGPEYSPWEYVQYELSIREVFFEGFSPYERFEFVSLSLLSLGFAGLVGWLVLRIRRDQGRLLTRPWFAWRLKTLMIVIAVVAIEYGIGKTAWGVKERWNECLFWANYYSPPEVDEVYLSTCDPEDQKSLRAWFHATQSLHWANRRYVYN